MKKIVLSILLCTLLVSEVKAETKETVLVYIKGYDALYLIDIYDTNINIKEINTNMYLPILCLSNECTTINSIDFTKAYDCLITSLENVFNTSITSYLSVDLNTLLNDLDIAYPSDSSLDTMNSLCSKIKKKIGITTIMNYQDYIDTNIDFNDLYTYYKLSKEDINIDLYVLEYYVIQDSYLVFNSQFHLIDET